MFKRFRANCRAFNAIDREGWFESLLEIEARLDVIEARLDASDTDGLNLDDRVGAIENRPEKPSFAGVYVA